MTQIPGYPFLLKNVCPFGSHPHPHTVHSTVLYPYCSAHVYVIKNIKKEENETKKCLTISSFHLTPVELITIKGTVFILRELL